jgi:Tol biopolymer transport system component
VVIEPPPEVEAPPVVDAPVPPPIEPAPPAVVPPTPVVADLPPPAPPARSALPTASTPVTAASLPPPPAAPGAVPGWTGPGAAAGAKRGSNTKLIVAGVGVVLVGVVALSALAELAGGGGGSDSSFDPISFSPQTFAPRPAVVTELTDAHRIVFSNDGSGNGDLYAVDPAGTSIVQLTSDANDDRYPSWSPDGRQIAFTRVLDHRGDIWVMDADGSNQRQLTNGAANDWAPDWTNDGRVLFTSDRSEDDGVSQDIWIVGLEGAGPEFLFGVRGRDDSTAVVSHVSNQIAFASNRADDGGRSMYMLDGAQEAVRLTSSGWLDGQPAWAPDGVTLVFARTSAGNPASDLWWVHSIDHTTGQMTTSAADDGHPAYSPDGVSIAWHSRIGASYHVMVGGDGAATRDLTTGLAGNSVEPSWR